jgi:hypothetical protein
MVEHFTVSGRKHRVPLSGCRDNGRVDRFISQGEVVGRPNVAASARGSRNCQEDADMTLAGLAVTFLGFVIAFVSLGATSSTGGRMSMVLVGIVVSLVGIMGVITPAYQKQWIGKR